MINLLTESPILFFVLLSGLLLALSFHEFCHALAGKWLGDRTAEEQGRLTVNPLAHIDVTGLLLLLFAGFGYAKPVPYNPYRLKYPSWGPVAIALAGPLSNLLFGFVSVIVYALFVQKLGYNNLLIIALGYLSIINFSLALFNLVPLPPLDGSKVLMHALDKPQTRQLYHWFEKNGTYLLLGAIFVDLLGLFPVFSWIGAGSTWLFEVSLRILS